MSKTSTVKSSNRPKIIPTHIIHFAESGSGSNVPAGPMMSPRPGRITDVIESPLPKERPLDIRDTQEFLDVAHRVREGLRTGHVYDD